MRIRFKPIYLVSIVLGIITAVIDFFLLLNTRWFVAVLILSINICWGHFWYDFYLELQRQKEIELKFLEFIRSLVGSVRSGIPLSKSVGHIADEDYGPFSPYVKKLANQIEWGIPLHRALIIMSNDTGNSMIKRSISIIIEADKSGGDIRSVLESVSESVYTIKRLREERRSETHGQIIQGYIVFYIFIAIMLVIQLWLTPQLSILSSDVAFEGKSVIGSGPFSGVLKSAGSGTSDVDLDSIFFFLIIIQGFFAGLTIGKFSEGSIKQGLVHSLILITSALLAITLVKGGI
ncbi:MAG: type II secretion system F family protein [Nanoarchaeota archaeon]